MFSFKVIANLVFIFVVIACLFGHVNVDVANNKPEQTQSVDELNKHFSDKMALPMKHTTTLHQAAAVALQNQDNASINHLNLFSKIHNVGLEQTEDGKAIDMNLYFIPYHHVAPKALQDQDGRPKNHPKLSKSRSVKFETMKDVKVTAIRHQALWNLNDQPINYQKQAYKIHNAMLDKIRDGRIIDHELKSVEPKATFTPPKHARRNKDDPASQMVEFTMVPLL